MSEIYPPMDRDEYRRARRYFGLSPEGFAEMIGVSWRHHMRYDAGHNIPRPTAKLIRTLIRHNIPPEEVG